jgi:tetratricopeptide (TPR) repeat protein
MSLKASVRAIPVILLMAGWADAQDPVITVNERRPVFINTRTTNEDPSVIDITEITQQYAKAAVEEYEKALGDARKGDRAAALARLQAAIKIEPTFFNARNSLAILYHQMKQYRDAEKEYLEAQRLNPRAVATFVNLAGMRIEEALGYATENPMASRGILNDALKSLHEGLRVEPRSVQAQYLVGVVYYMTSFFEEAETHFKKALEYSGDRMLFARLALADVYIRIQEWDNVVVQLDAYLQRNPFGQNRELIRSVRDDAAKKAETSSQ